MATSGVYTNQLTRNQLVEAVLKKLAVLSEGQTPSAQNYTDVQTALNLRIAEFRTLGMPLWARESFTFTPTTNQYTIGQGQTLNAVYPVKVLQAYRTETNTKIDMEVIPREEYNILPSNTSGSPLKLSYQPNINSGTIWLWPSPSVTNTATVTIVYVRPIQYFTGNTETLDMPEEWYNALIFNTAVDLSPEWSVPLPDRQWLEKQAEKHLEIALGVGQDVGSFYIQPERQR